MNTSALSLILAGTVSIASAQITKFDHVVVIFQENRTPDNLFQGLCAPPYGSPASCSTQPTDQQYNIQTSNWRDSMSKTGVTQPGMVALSAKYDLSHAHSAFLKMCNADSTGACRMDGAAAIPCSGKCQPNPQFRAVDNSAGIVNPYLDLVTSYGWGNYMFQTNQGPSFPAHQFIFGGTSAASAVDDQAGIFASENMSTNTGIGGTTQTAGCIAPASTTVAVIDSSGNEMKRIYPCFEHMTLPDLLPPTFSWRYYAPNAGSIWTAPNAIQHICESTGAGGSCAGQQWKDNVDLKPANVLTDIANCNLRSVSWVIPTGANSDHANANDGGGPSWVTAITNAIGNSSGCDGGQGYWNNTAIIITWDDWGGWYDHEPPQILPAPQGAYQLGFRVPLIIVSAYTPAGYINNVPHDFGSILRFIEQNFGVAEGALTFADARATTDLRLFFNLDNAPRAYTTVKAPKSAKFFIKDKRKATDPDDQ